MPNDGGMTFIDENDEVLVAGFGRKGHAVGDLPGVRFKIVKVAGVSLLALWLRKKEKPIKWILFYKKIFFYLLFITINFL